RPVAGRGEQLAMHRQIGEPEVRHPALSCTQQLARTSEAQILFRNDETVIGLAESLESRFRGFSEWRLIHKQAGRAVLSAPDAAAKLVELGQSEPLRMFDHHDRGFWHIDA